MAANALSLPGWFKSKRRYYAVIGILLIAIGQYLIAKIDEIAAPSTPPGIWANDFFRLGMHTIDTVLAGSLFCILGGIILATGISHAYPEEEILDDSPLAFAQFRPAWIIGILIGGTLFTILSLQLNRGGYHWYSPWFWLGNLAIFLGIAIGWDQQRGINFSPGLQRQDMLWLTGLLIFGFLIATYRLQGWPDQLMHDEGIFGSTARDVARGTFTLPIFAQGVDSYPILSTFWQAGVMKLFGINIWGWRFASVLPGVLSVVPLFLLVRDLFNRKLAVISSLALLTTPYFLVYARLGYTNIQPEFLVTLTLYLIHLGIRRTSHTFILLSSFIAGLGFYTYFSGRSAFVIAVLFIVLSWLNKRIKFRKLVYTLALFVFGAALVALPHILYGIQQNPAAMSYRIFLSFFNSVTYAGSLYPLEELFAYMPSIWLGEIEVFYNPKIYPILIFRGFTQTLLAYQKPGLLWGGHYLACPLAGTIGAFFYFMGVVIAVRRLKQIRYQLVLLWFFTIITLLSALNTFPPREDHMVPILPALSILTALGIEAFVDAAASAFAWVTKHRQSIIAALLVIVVAGGLRDYFVLGYQKFPPKAEDVMSWAGLNSNGETFSYVYEIPYRDDFVPWMMHEFRTDVKFQALPMDTFLENSALSDNSQKNVVFYPPELDSQLTPFLEAQWGSDLRKSVFLDANGNPALMAGMNTAFVFERERRLESTFLDAFKQVPFMIFLAAFLLGFGRILLNPTQNRL